MGGCIWKRTVLVNSRNKIILTYHCAQSRISDIVEFTIDVADLVTNLPGRAEKRDNFTVGVLKLQEQVRKKFNGSKPARTHHNIHSRSAWPPSVLKTVGSCEVTRPLEENRRYGGCSNVKSSFSLT